MPIISVVSAPNFELANILELQTKDPDLAQLVNHLQTCKLPGNSSDDRKVIAKADQYVLQDGMLYHFFSPSPPYRRQETRCQLVISRSLIGEVITSMHDDVSAGHSGIGKTCDKIRQRHFWQGMYIDITHWIEACKNCVSKKSPKQSIPVEGPFDRICVGFFRPTTPSEQGSR